MRKKENDQAPITNDQLLGGQKQILDIGIWLLEFARRRAGTL